MRHVEVGLQLGLLPALGQLSHDVVDVDIDERQIMFPRPISTLRRIPVAKARNHLCTMSSTLSKPGDINLTPSHRHIRVFDKAGTLLADSKAPVELDEYRLPTRFYLPSDDVKWDALEKVDHKTYCPYKGTADRYWRAKSSGDAIAWGYSDPLPAVKSIKDLVAFYNERLKIEVDGKPLA